MFWWEQSKLQASEQTTTNLPSAGQFYFQDLFSVHQTLQINHITIQHKSLSQITADTPHSCPYLHQLLNGL